MPIETNLGQAPYYDDHDPLNNYHRILFKPSVAVQARELNQLQTLLQEQIERFGDAVYKRGTIIQGCSFSFYNKYDYVKLLDNQTDGSTFTVAELNNLFIKNSANLQAYVINYIEGFESTDPDLKTLYLNYINSGDDGNSNTFTAADTLTVFDSNNSLYSIVVDNGSLGFSNTDSIVITPAIAVNVSTGTWSNGDNLYIPATGANVEIVFADNLTLANSGQVLLYCRPRSIDLANASANDVIWTLVQGADCRDPSNTVICTIENIFGSGASANLVTLSNGRIANVNMVSRGSNYVYAPEVDVYSPDNSSGIATVDLTARNYYAKVTVSSVTNAVGQGYGFKVGDGVIYQKGNFIRVEDQTVLIDKYSISPNNVTVGFVTQESFIDSNIDPSLLDNSLGTENETAPGADRLKLEPVLTVTSTANAQANNDFYVLVEWNEGRPYRQNQFTDFSGLGDELSKRQFDSTGNFVVDTFQVTTKTPTSENSAFYTAAVDPGQAYISGRKVQTRRNFNIDVQQGIDTLVANNEISLNYGNYVRIKEVGGTFATSNAALIDLYDTARAHLSTQAQWESGTITATGTKIGEARARAMVLENGVPGEANTIYRIYLFDIKMNPGKEFANTRSLYYNGVVDGIADTITETDPTTNEQITVLEGQDKSKLIFRAGVESLKNSNLTSYQYRTVNTSQVFANTGVFTYDISSTGDEFWPYGSNAELSDTQMKELVVIPTAQTMVAFANVTGTITATAASNTLTGSGTAFVTDLRVGDYIQLIDGANNDIRRVSTITNQTSLTVDSNWGEDFTAGTPAYRCFPQNVPLPLGERDGLSANVDVTRDILSIHTNFALGGTSSFATSFAGNIRRENVVSTAKSANRTRYVKIQISNNVSGNSGPWCLGVPDVFRLERVYTHTATTVNVDSDDVTANFYIDSNQTANFSDLSWLYVNPTSRYNVTDSDFLLVRFSYSVKASEGGYFDTTSYLNTSTPADIYATDSAALATLTTEMSSWEVPEVYTARDEYFDLLNCFDFRPSVANTVVPNTNPTNAPINPPTTRTFPNQDLKFPAPDGVMTSQIDQYMGRIDHVCISGEDGSIFVLKGQPAVDPRKRYEPNHPKDALKLQVLSVPPYPAITRFPSERKAEMLSTGINNEKRLQLRTKSKVVIQLLSSEDMQLSQPMGYTMEDIGNLERRIRDLEYYVSLSVLETSITNKQIPSSVDRTLNRFKFGFIADDFETDLYTDNDNPQYAAAKELIGDFTYGQYKSPMESNQARTDGVDPETKSIFSNAKITKKIAHRVTPPKYPWVHKHFIDNLDYVHQRIVTQPYATQPTTDRCVIGENIDAGNTGYYTVVTGHPNIRTDYLTFGPDSGIATLYFYNYGGGDKIEIFQGNTLVASTNATSSQLQNLTAADKVFLSTNTFATTWYSTTTDGGVPNLDREYVREGATEYVKYAGKLVWSHDPLAESTANRITRDGRAADLGESFGAAVNYKVVVEKSSQSTTYRYLLQYPDFDGQNNLIVEPCTPPSPTAYNGVMTIDVQTQWSCSKLFNTYGQFFDRIQVFCTGLRPNTKHNFYLDGIIDNEDARQLGKRRGDPLISDERGRLFFQFIIDETWLTKIKNDNGGYNFWGQNTWATEAVFGSTGYTLFEIRGNNSSAKSLVANRAPTKILK